MSALVRAAWAVSLLATSCGARTTLGERATRDAAVDASARDAVAEAAHGFACGETTCTDSSAQYCLQHLGGCEGVGEACASSADCCSGVCAAGNCAVPSADASAGASDTCEPLSNDCRVSPSCACVLSHAPCGPSLGPPPSCVQAAGVITVTCAGE